MTRPDRIPARVRSVETLSPTLRRVVLEPTEASLFPTGSAGAHIVLEMRHDEHIWRNAYSLVSSPEHRRNYTIIVRRVAASRGGSAYIHDHLQPGTLLSVGMPSNLFPIQVSARKHLMVAGGIGVTPFLSYLPLLAAAGSPYALHLCTRAEDAEAFRRLLAPWPQSHLYISASQGGLDLNALFETQPLGTHLYLCGPEQFMAEVVASALALGWPEARLHQEHFIGAAPGAPFRAVLARSGMTIEIASDQGLLDAIEAAGIDAPCLCRAGACGECRLTLLDGVAEHRDHFLTEDERADGRSIMPCVSRAKSAVLVLDI
jgi:ferredoxin-NADP reductase